MRAVESLQTTLSNEPTTHFQIDLRVMSDKFEHAF